MSRSATSALERRCGHVLLSDPESRFHGLGPGYYDSRINPERKKCNHIRELEALGYRVTFEPAALRAAVDTAYNS